MSRTRTLWEEGRTPGYQLVALASVVGLSLAFLDLVLTDRVGTLFDVCFVALCLGLALAVRPSDFFTVAVLPPPLMVALFVVVGYALCLGCLALRQRVFRLGPAGLRPRSGPGPLRPGG